MIKKNLFMLFVIYFFVIQFFFAWLFWGDQNWLYLGGVNLLAIVILIGIYKFFTKEQDKKSDLLIVKESQELITAPKIDEDQGEVQVASDEPEVVISESSIEYIKTKINRAKRPALAPNSGWYRLLMFLLGLVGFGGILYMFWDTFDFFALIAAGLAMMFFLAVIFKTANLRRKSLFLSGYFWVFILSIGVGIVGLVFQDEPQVEKVKSEITTFVNGIKGVESGDLVIISDPSADSGFVLLEEEESATGVVLSGVNEMLSGGIGTGEGSLSGDVLLQGNKEIQQNGESSIEVKTPDEEKKQGPVTILEAIKHLVETYEIPLSTSKNVKFTHIATTNPDYPYMKTALEKKMVGANTSPTMQVSCEVYIVMKGIVEGWKTVPTGDVKADFRKVAVQKDALNGCTKGAKLSFDNL